MKVLFIKDVKGQGARGQVRDVSSGYAQNFLIKNGFAVIATGEVQQKLNREAAALDASKEKLAEKNMALKSSLEKHAFTIRAKVGDNGKLFGAVREKDIAYIISKKLATEINPKTIHSPEPIKTTGSHVVNITLSGNISAQVKIFVEAV